MKKTAFVVLMISISIHWAGTAFIQAQDRTPSMSKLLELMQGEDILAINEAAKKIVQYGKDAVPPLLELLESENRDSRAGALMALGYIRDPSAVDPILEYWRKLGIIAQKEDTFAEKYLRHEIIRALGNLNDKKAVPLLQQSLETDDQYDRTRALISLASLGEDEAYKELLRTLKHDNGDIRNMAVQGLGKLARKESIDALVPLLSDEHWYVRDNAVEALGKIGGEKAYQEIKKLTQDENPFVQRTARETLESMKR